MKRIISLLLILVLTLGCLGVSASATNPVYPPVQSVTVNNNLAQLNTSGTNLTYCARVTGADLSSTTFTIVMMISDPSKNVTATLSNVTGTITTNEVYNDEEELVSITWSGVKLTSTTQFSISWANNGQTTCGLEVETAAGNATLQGITIGGVTATPGSITVGGVTRYTYSAILGTNASLTNLVIAPTPAAGHANTTTYKLDGNDVSGTITADFTAQTHVLTVTDGTDTRDYLLSACAPNEQGKIPVYLGIRTWAAVDFNHNNYTHYNYSQYGTGSGDSTLDAKALSIDTVGSRQGATAVAAPTWTVDSVSGNSRPVFLTSEYDTVYVSPGASVMDALVAYASTHGLTLTGVEDSYISTISSNSGSLGYGSCGWGDGWMYLVRPSNTDVATDMPNLAADNYIVTGGQYIDWVFSCAFGEDFGYSIMSW